MDNTQTTTAIEWFYGYGGNNLGLGRVIPSLRTIAACEIEGYACANMVSKIEAGLLDPFPTWTDVKTFPIEGFRGLVDIFIASYPCQGFSAAGKRAGSKDPRFLWPYVLRAVAIMEPSLCFFENVEGHVSLGLREVISDLESCGYRTTWGIFSAAECGAPQRRKRVFIMAHRKDLDRQILLRWGGPQQASSESGGGRGSLANSERAERRQETRSGDCGGQGQANGRKQSNCGIGECGAVVADSERESWCAEQFNQAGERENKGQEKQSVLGTACGGLNMANTAHQREREPDNAQRPDARQDARQDAGGGSDGLGLAESTSPRLEGRPRQSGDNGQEQPTVKRSRPIFWPDFVAGPGQPQKQWEPTRVTKTQRGLGGGFTGYSSNVDRLRLLGNGVYPATAERAFRTLINRLTK